MINAPTMIYRTVNLNLQMRAYMLEWCTAQTAFHKSRGEADKTQLFMLEDTAIRNAAIKGGGGEAV